MTAGETAALAVGILAIVAPWLWRSMSRVISYPLATIGFLLLGWSGILLLEELTGMNIQPGPLTTIIIGAIIVAAGVYWQIHLAQAQAPHAVAQLQPGTAQNNTMGPVINNGGIVTQGQTGNNVVVNPRVVRILTDDLKSGLLKITKDRPVLVLGMNGNTESMAFANEIYDFLKANGYKMVGDAATWHMFFNPPVFTVNISDHGSQWWVIVGPAE